MVVVAVSDSSKARFTGGSPQGIIKKTGKTNMTIRRPDQCADLPHGMGMNGAQKTSGRMPCYHTLPTRSIIFSLMHDCLNSIEVRG